MEGFTSQEKEVAKYILENISLIKELSTEFLEVARVRELLKDEPITKKSTYKDRFYLCR